MIEVITNIPMVLGNIFAKFAQLDNPETVSRAVAVAMMPEIRERIHVRGENTAGQKIGAYSSKYLKLRQKKYNRTADGDVIFSLTRQLENSYVLEGKEKSYNIGFATPLSYQKSVWLEEKFGRVFGLTATELEQAKEVAVITTNEILNK